MSSSLAGLTSDHLAPISNSTHSALGSRRSPSVTRAGQATQNGKDASLTPIRRAVSRTLAPASSNGRSRSRSAEDRQANGDTGTGSEAETVVESPAKRKLQKSMSTAPSADGRVVSKNGVDGKKRLRNDVDGMRVKSGRESPKRVRRESGRDSSPTARKSTVHKIRSSSLQRRDDAFSSDLSSAPSSPPPPTRRLKNSSRLTNARTHQDTKSGSDVGMSDAESTHRAMSSGPKKTRSAELSRKGLDRRSSLDVIPRLTPGTKEKLTGTEGYDNSPLKSQQKKRKVPPPLRPHDDRRLDRTNNGRVARSGSVSSRGTSPASDALGSRLPRPPSVKTPGSPIMAPHRARRDANGRTLLHKACEKGNLAEVEEIYNNNKEDIREKDFAGYIPLHEAALNGHADVVRFLLSKSSAVDEPSIDGDTPLLDAVENNHIDVVKLLLEAGADPRRKNKGGNNALDAIQSENEASDQMEQIIRDAINKLKSSKKSEDERRMSVVESVSSRDQSLAASPGYQSPPNTSSLPQVGGRRRARTDNNLLWLEGGKAGPSALRDNARLGVVQRVSWLLEQGVPADVESLTAAVRGGHEECVSLLLAMGAPADPPQSSHTSASNRNKVSSAPADDETPMEACIGRGNLKILEYLLDKVDPRKTVASGMTYMDLARKREGENWEKEVSMIQSAYDKAVASRGSASNANHDPSSKNPAIKRAKSPSTARRRLSTSKVKERNGPATSDVDSIADAEHASVPKRPRKHESQTPSPPVVKRRRRLVSGRDLELRSEKNDDDSDEEMRSTPPRKIKPERHPVSSSPSSARNEKRNKREEKREERPATPLKRETDKDKERPEKPDKSEKRKREGDSAATEGMKRDAPKKVRAESTASEKPEKRQLDAVKSKSKLQKSSTPSDVKEGKDSSEVSKKLMRPKDLKARESPQPKVKTEKVTPAPETAPVKEKRKLNSNGDSNSKPQAEPSKRRREERKEKDKDHGDNDTEAARKQEVEAKRARRQRKEEALAAAERERVALEQDKARQSALAEEQKAILEKATAESKEQKEASQRQRELELAEEKRKLEEQERIRREQEARLAVEAKREAEKEAEAARKREEERINSLPHTLKELALETMDVDWNFDMAQRFLPLKIVELPGTEPEKNMTRTPQSLEDLKAFEKWITNIQVALILRTKDFSLSSFSKYISHRIPIPASNEVVRSRIWRCTHPLFADDVEYEDDDSGERYSQYLEGERCKFFATDMFFVKLEDLRKIVRNEPKYRELAESDFHYETLDIADGNPKPDQDTLNQARFREDEHDTPAYSSW